MAERLGPDNMHTLLNRFFALGLEAVHRYEGTINQFLGDGFMALFGAPIAHEDHARRAVLAALALQRTSAAEPMVVFKHALTQEVAYGSLLTTRRHALHAAAGQTLERLAQERLAERSEELAHRFTVGQGMR